MIKLWNDRVKGDDHVYIIGDFAYRNEKDEEWYLRQLRGHTHIYGHIHNQRSETYQFMRTRKNALNAGCMINGYSPVSLRELIRNNEIWNETKGE